MPSPRPPLAKAVALKSLEWAVRFWPHESRHWGQALLAETHEIPHPIEALFWALGGVIVFLRSHLSRLVSLLKLPPGQTSALPLASGGTGPSFPRNSRFVTAILLLAVIVLFLLPVGKEALSTVISSWKNFDSTAADSRAVDRLAARAEKDRDARLLAFAAICHPDPDRASQLADKAVSLDPRLVWIYASRFRRPQDTPMHKEWLNRLRDSDPDNAFVYLLSAEVDAGPQGDLWITKMTSTDPDNAKIALRDSEWSNQMEQAFRAPRYDSYWKAHQDLSREGWRKAPEVPATLVAYSTWSHQIPNLAEIRAYADFRFLEGRAAASNGHAVQAEDDLNQIVAFGQRVMAGSHTDIERLMAMFVTRRGLEGLRDLYAGTGRTQEAQTVALQIRGVEESKDRLVHTFSPVNAATLANFRRTALVVHASAALAVLLILLTGFSLLCLELGHFFPWVMAGSLRGFACRIIDYAPASILIVSGIFLLSFQPFAVALQHYRTGSLSAEDLFDWQFWALASRNPFAFLFTPSWQSTFWLFVVIALAGAAILVILRSLLRHRAAHTPAR